MAATIDLTMRPLFRARGWVVPSARGEVLELGAGTGLNFALYDPVRVRRVVGVEPDRYMLERARPRAAQARVPIELVLGGGERLPFADGRFDTAVLTWVLCTIPEPAAALAEVRRVLRPGGRLVFVEHTRSVQRGLARAQSRLTPLWMKLAGGCHLDRPGVELVARSGLELGSVRSFGRERWTLVPMYWGEARKADA